MTISLHEILAFIVREAGWNTTLKTLIAIIRKTNPEVADKLMRSLETPWTQEGPETGAGGIAHLLKEKWEREYPVGVPWRRMLTDVKALASLRAAATPEQQEYTIADELKLPVLFWLQQELRDVCPELSLASGLRHGMSILAQKLGEATSAPAPPVETRSECWCGHPRAQHYIADGDDLRCGAEGCHCEVFSLPASPAPGGPK